MFAGRTLAAVILAAGLCGCGVVGQQGALPPAHTKSYETEPAPALTAGVDAMSGLEQRPMRPPTMAPNGTCWASSSADLAGAPNYGAGVGPAYLSGQYSWYSSGQVATILVDSRYSGPLLVRPFELAGAGKLTVTLSDLPEAYNGLITDKERQHGVGVVSGFHTAAGGLFLNAVTRSSLSRAWFGRLATDGPGCFGLQVDGDVFTEFIVIEVHAGNPPPG